MAAKGQPTLIDRSRKATINAAADFFEGLAQLKRFHKRTFPDDRAQRRGNRSDFLLDLLRLNVDYVNRVAELSKEHHRLATRSLERLYNIATPRIFADQTPELVFGGTDQVWTRTFSVENKLDPSLELGGIRVYPFQGPKPSKSLHVVPTLRVDGAIVPLDSEPDAHGKTVSQYGGFELSYRTRHDVQVSIQPGGFPGHVLYSGELEITIGDRVRRIPLTVDKRKGEYV